MAPGGGAEREEILWPHIEHTEGGLSLAVIF